MNHFTWVLGEGYCERALARLASNFSMPKEPMGEAWFMGESRYMYNYLKNDLDAISNEKLVAALDEVASGTHSFGYRSEWSSWYHYLLSRLIPRCHGRSKNNIVEYLITAFITQYPHGTEKEPYKGFHQDVLFTLGKCIMGSHYGYEDKAAQETIFKNPEEYGYWRHVCGDISSSLFFCLKYLHATEIPRWLESVLAIESPYFRAQIIVWLVDAQSILNKEIEQPSQFNSEDLSIEWQNSYLLDGNYSGDHRKSKKRNKPLLPEENRKMVLNVISETIDEDFYLDWLESITKDDYLDSWLFEIPERFARIYVYK